jgi:DNA replication factor GINS
MTLTSDSPMTFDEISELYRVEHKSKSLTEVRKDLYPAMAALIRQLKADYERILAKDIDSPLAEGINEKRKKARDHARSIVDLRLGKISKMALRGAMGGDIDISRMTKEERAFYDSVLKNAQYMRGLVDRMSGNAPFRLPDIETPEPAKEAPAKEVEPAPMPRPEPVKVPETDDSEIPDDWGEDSRPQEETIVKSVPAKAAAPADDGIPDDWGEPSVDAEEASEPEIPEDDAPDELDRMMAQPAPKPAPQPRPQSTSTSEAAAPEPVPAGGDEDEEEGTDEEMELDAEMGMPMRPASAPKKKARRTDLMLVRVLQDVPMPIAGPDRNYVLKKEDVLYMPDVLAVSLVQAGIASEIKVKM